MPCGIMHDREIWLVETDATRILCLVNLRSRARVSLRVRDLNNANLFVNADGVSHAPDGMVVE